MIAAFAAAAGVQLAGAQRVTVSLDADRGGFAVAAFTYGRPVTYDTSRLHFTIASLTPNAPRARALQVRIGAAYPGRTSPSPGGPVETMFPLQIIERPAPGMYEVLGRVDDGFARFSDGSPAPLEDNVSGDVYWPDESGSDADLMRVRSALAGHSVHGFGGISLSCGAAAFRDYSSDVAVAVRRVERRRGFVERLWTGAMPSRGNDAAFSFFAIDPIAVYASFPSAKPVAYGGSTFPAGDAPCPGFDVAGLWHADISVTTASPPPMRFDTLRFDVAVGMTRADVAWRHGFPPGRATRAELMRSDEWDYDNGPPDSWMVRFRNGRVVSFTTPHGLP